MHRRVMEDVQLKDGTELRAGSNVAVSAERMWDSTVHEDPDIFDGYRYYNMRRNGKAAGCQLVNTSIDHMGFGHGRHACPGRFFAADESKIILSHLLLKYDWKMSSEQKPVQRIFGFFSSPDDTIKAAMKRRQEEVALP
jgi:cytochrome P450